MIYFVTAFFLCAAFAMIAINWKEISQFFLGRIDAVRAKIADWVQSFNNVK